MNGYSIVLHNIEPGKNSHHGRIDYSCFKINLDKKQQQYKQPIITILMVLDFKIL